MPSCVDDACGDADLAAVEADAAPDLADTAPVEMAEGGEEAPDPCAATCEGHCGTVDACECGGCEPGWDCTDNACVIGCAANPDEPDDKFEDTNCDLIDGDAKSSIFVAPAAQGGDDANPGTREKPKATIQAGIDAAKTGGRKAVLVSAGTYTGTVTLVAGVSVYGGYDAAAAWKRDDATLAWVTASAPDAQGGQRGIRAKDIPAGTPTFVDRVAVTVPDNAVPGGTNYGVHATAADGLRLSNLVLKIGKGGDGAAGAGLGAAGSPGGGTGGAGLAGVENDATPQCQKTAVPAPGNGGVAQACAFGTSPGAGGKGGEVEGDGGAGKAGEAGAGPGGVAGAGGAGGDGGSKSDGLAGGQGPAGAAGVDGSGGTGLGLFLDGSYVPAAGDASVAATDGGPGSGGGGGGAGGFGYNSYGTGLGTRFCSTTGGTGGGGGAGGCGGQRGAPGGGGGGAFGILLIDTNPEARDVAVKVASGGKGGDGQAGGEGSAGGAGGAGGAGTGTSDLSGLGGQGGEGGPGGRGGHGGGGGGGPSICYFFHTPTGTIVPNPGKLKNCTCEGPEPAAGGGGPGNAGESGRTVTIDQCGPECAAQAGD
jgi:hypothetical protein